MKRVLLPLGVCLLVSVFSYGQDQSKVAARSQSAAAAAEARSDTSESSTTGRLPVRRVVLYKNGVGYFEHLGRVRGSQDVHIDFTSAQLNDVLKSLTVLDLSGGRITGVDYNSEAPLARRLATLRLALGEKPSVSEFLGALRGARLEVRGATGPALTGKLLGVERKTRNAANWTVETDEISLITDGGEVRSVDLNPTTSVRIIDHDLQAEVGKYLGLIASAREQDVRRMTVSTAGTGERKLYVSYISEVPIWKTTYRIVLPSKAKKSPLLQGWAIVDNTVGEDWNDVELSLVAGAPHSFIQQLSEPYYGRRPVVPLPESVELSPQTHAGTLAGGNGTLNGTVSDASGALVAGAIVRLLNDNNGTIAQTTSDSNGQYSFSELSTAQSYRVEVERLGFQKILTTNVNIGPGENRLNSQLQVGAATQTVEVTADSSMLQTSSAEILANNNKGKMPVARRPRVGASGGVIGGIGGGTFSAGVSGRNAMPPLAPPPGVVTDLGLLVEAQTSDQPQHVRRAKILHGVMTQTSELHERTLYTVRNQDDISRTLVVEHPSRPQWKLAKGAKEPDERAAATYRFRIDAPAKATTSLPVEEIRTLDTAYQLSNLDGDQIALFLKQGTITPEMAQALQKITAQKAVVAKLEEEMENRQKDIDRIVDDQGRLRENMKALRGSAEEKVLLQRYTRQLDEQETQLEGLRKKIEDTEARRDKANEELEKMIDELQIEATL